MNALPVQNASVVFVANASPCSSPVHQLPIAVPAMDQLAIQAFEGVLGAGQSEEGGELSS
ncbi:hypothetical protein N7454_001206 [Penicillium verhagenii]|nr:hypothetical protein N7454_001206 [Penicillium verhagenii]